MNSGDDQWEAFLKATPDEVHKLQEGLRAQHRRERPATIRIGILVGSAIGLGMNWYRYGWPVDPYFTLIFLGFFSIVALLWSISVALENIAGELLTLAHPVRLLFYGTDMGMSIMEAYNLRRKLGMQIEYDWEQRILDRQNRVG